MAFTLWPETQPLSCPGGCPLSSLLVLLYGIRGGKAEEEGEGGVEGRWREQVRGRTVWASQGEGWGRERTCPGHHSPSCCPRGWTWCPGAPPGVQTRPPAGGTHNEHVAADHQAEIPGEGAHKVHQGRPEVGGPREHQALGAEEGKGKGCGPSGQSWGSGCQIQVPPEFHHLPGLPS